MGYLEQGQTYTHAETLNDFLGVGEAVMEDAAARVAELATQLAGADAASQAPLMDAYAAAVAELELLSTAQPPLHEAEAVLARLVATTGTSSAPSPRASGRFRMERCEAIST